MPFRQGFCGLPRNWLAKGDWKAFNAFMGAIKDITDLTIKLLDSKEGRKFAAEIAKIQSLTLALQSEQAAIVEKNADLLAENLDLKRKAFDLQEFHAQEMAACDAKIKELEAQLSPKTADALSVELIKVLKMFFFQGNTELSNHNVVQHLQVSMSMANYYIDELLKRGFIRQTQAEFGDDDVRGMQPARYKIDASGRAYIVEKGLAN